MSLKLLFYLLALLQFIYCSERRSDSGTNDQVSVQFNVEKEQVIASNRFRTGQQYLDISNIQVLKKKKIAQLSFELAWDASWRDYENYDAAWIFFKLKTRDGLWFPARVMGDSPHMLLNNSNDKTDAAFELPRDRLGLFVYRSKISQGDNRWRIALDLDLPEDRDIIEIKAFGLEMVYVPEGPFELGTLKNITQRREVLTPGAGGAPYNPFFSYSSSAKDNYGGVFRINSEGLISIGKQDGSLFWIDANIPGTNTFSGVPQGVLSGSYPKGYRGFYQMKYELSQAQYCDFLNTLSPLQQKARDISEEIEYQRPIKDYRNAIRYQAGFYSSDRPLRPCNFLSWLDGQAYADWAGLRHMTELEFEKACRGPLHAVYREYVWGVNEINQKRNMEYCGRFLDPSGALSSAELGQERLDGNVHASMFSYFNIDDVCKPGSRFYDPDCAGCRSFQGGDGGRGPVRMGIFGVTSGGDRIKAGATYYGAMEMGGNLQEPVVTVGHPNGRKFQGSHGDGQLSPEGLATNPDWLASDQDWAFAGRGGCWKFHENHARTSDRFKGLRTRPNRRASHIGFRGVRTKR